MTYLLGSGYYHKDPQNPFVELWIKCLLKNIVTPPIVFSIVAVGDSRIPSTALNEYFNTEGRWPMLSGNCFTANPGHLGDLLNNSKKGEICGWSGTVILLAMQAYMEGLDLVFYEQDVLCKGDVIAQAFRDLGDKKMIFGGKMNSAPHMPAAQSLVIIKHDFLLPFIHDYIGMGNEREDCNMPEHKFDKLYHMHPNEVGFLSFGVDREKPIPWDSEHWYAQKFTHEELEEYNRRTF